MKSLRKIFLLACYVGSLTSFTACGGGSAGSQSVRQESLQAGVSSPLPISSGTETTATPPPVPVEEEAPQLPAGLSIRGRVTFDHVPFDSRRYKGLDYSRTEARPARGVTVQLLDALDRVTASTQTNGNGEYLFTVAENSQVKVRVLAELMAQDTAAWDIKVRDNTRANAHFVLDGALAAISDGSQQRDIHAHSGWTGSGYSTTRSAAPFAILDSIYVALLTVVQADPHVVLPPLDVFWSPDNIAMRGDLSIGQIGTSFFTSAGPSIYLLGAADNDSDEYDRAVVQHEFAHFLEHELGRSESIGGNHNINTRLDLRLAFAEAWGNAFAGMVSGDPLYRDSLGPQQSSGFTIDVETTSFGRQGWFSEDTLQSIFYDLFDSTADADDHLALGFLPLFRALFSERFLDAPGVASIYSFAEVLKQQNPDQRAAIDQLLTDSQIFGRGWLGDGESNTGAIAHALPVYTHLSADGPREVCSDNSVQEYNGLGVRRLLAVSLPQAGRYTFSARRTSGTVTDSNPQMRLLNRGSQIAWARNTTRDVETISRSLEAGNYVLEVYEESNADRDKGTGGLACFTVTIQ